MTISTVPNIAEKRHPFICISRKRGLEKKTARTSFCRADPSLSSHSFVESKMPKIPITPRIPFSQARGGAQ